MQLASQAAASCISFLFTAGGLSMIAKQEGIKGLYRGLTPTLVALLPNWAVSFSLFAS